MQVGFVLIWVGIKDLSQESARFKEDIDATDTDRIFESRSDHTSGLLVLDCLLSSIDMGFYRFLYEVTDQFDIGNMYSVIEL